MNSIVFLGTNLFPVIGKSSFTGDRVSNPGICSVGSSGILVSEPVTEFSYGREIVKDSKDIQEKQGTGIITRRSPYRIFRSYQASYERPVKECSGKLAFGVIAL